MIVEIKKAIVECLRKDLEKRPNGLGLTYAVLRKNVKLKVSDPTFSTKIFCRALNDLVAKQKILIFGAIRQGYITFVLKTSQR